MFRKSKGNKPEESAEKPIEPSDSQANVKVIKTDEVPIIEDIDGKVMMVVGWALTVCLHLLVTSSLFYADGCTSAVDADTHNWDLPQLVGATSIWIYLGAFCTCSSFSSSMLKSKTCTVENVCSWEPTTLTRTLYALAVTFPSLSIIFSSVGILRSLTMILAGDWGSNDDGYLILLVLYTLNIILIGVLAMGLELPQHYQHLRHHRRQGQKAKAGASIKKGGDDEKSHVSESKEDSQAKQQPQEEKKKHLEPPHWLKERSKGKKEDELPASIRQAIPG